MFTVLIDSIGSLCECVASVSTMAHDKLAHHTPVEFSGSLDAGPCLCKNA